LPSAKRILLPSQLLLLLADRRSGRWCRFQQCFAADTERVGARYVVKRTFIVLLSVPAFIST